MEKVEIHEGDTLTGMDIPFFQTPNAIFEVGIPVNMLMVYIYLCRCSNMGKVAFPGYGKIARCCGFDRRTAIRSIKRLIDAGWVAKTTRPPKPEDSKQIHRSNVYHLFSPLIIETVDLVSESHYPIVSESHYPSVTESPYKEPRKKNITSNKNKDIRTTPGETLKKRHKEGTEKYAEQKYGHIVKR